MDGGDIENTTGNTNFQRIERFQNHTSTKKSFNGSQSELEHTMEPASEWPFISSSPISYWDSTCASLLLHLAQQDELGRAKGKFFASPSVFPSSRTSHWCRFDWCIVQIRC